MRLRPALGLGWRVLRASTAALFGRVTWDAPVWLRRLVELVSLTARRLAARPRLTGALSGAILVLAVGGSWGYLWWQARPRPVVVTYTVKAPERTEIESDKKPNPLVVTFHRSVAPLSGVGKDVSSGIAMSPALAGTWRWTSDTTLGFQPKDDWPIGAQYTVTFDKRAFTRDVRLAERWFTFQAPLFVLKLANAEFFQDPVDPALKKAVIGLSFSHPVDAAELEKRIELRLAGQSAGVLGVGRQTTKFTISYDKLGLNAYIHSAALPIPRESTTLTVTVHKGVVAARGGKAADYAPTQTITIPGLYSLRVNTVGPAVVSGVAGEQEQVLVVELSAAAHENEMQKRIAAWVLPVQHPEPRDPREKIHDWRDPAEITDAILAASTRLTLDPIAAERENVETHSFKYRADVGRYVYVQVERGLRGFGGYLLGDRMQRLVRVPPFPPELKILSQGSLLAVSGERKVAILVRDLPGLRIEVGRVLPSQLQHLVSQSFGDFAHPQFGNQFGSDNLVERFERKVPLPNLPRGRPHYHALDLSEYLRADGAERRGVFLLTVQSYDPAMDRPTDAEPGGADPRWNRERWGLDGRYSDRRLVLVTDLGILVKKALDGAQDVFVQSIHSGNAVTGATVDVIGKNGLVAFSRPTDATGRAQFPRLDGLTRERAALMYVVRRGDDTSFLPLTRSDRGLDLTRFDVGGVQNARIPDQLSAYLFSDRGLYRPGDTIHVAAIVKAAGWVKSLVGLPLEVEVVDPRGLTVKREKLALGAGGFSDLSHQTVESSPTGAYAVTLSIVKDGKPNQQIGSTTVNVQEFLPDRMKITAALSRDTAEGWLSPSGLTARVRVQNLFGTPAEKRRVEAVLTLSPAFPAFRSHAGYSFFDPQRAREGYSNPLGEATTDERGEADLELRLDRYARATYHLHFLARAFEPEGGRSVSAETAALVSELPFLVGYKPDGPLDYVTRGAKRTVSVIAIDPNARKTAVSGLKLVLVERAWVSVLTRQANNTYKYESRRKEITITEQPLAIRAAGLSLALATTRAGSFAYVVRDAQGLEMNRIEYTVTGHANVTRSLERNAELQLALDRKDYAPGDEIEVSIRAPYAGAGLVTIERERVYAHQWFKSSTLGSVQRIRIPGDFEGNGYVAVHYVRDPASEEIFMSPLSFGVVPFTLSLAQRTNTLTLTAAETVQPGQPLRITLAATQPARAVVFAVDEGILQVARYQTPDPLGHFFRKRMLEVRTAQILDLILPEFKRIMSAAAPGGDAGAELGRHLNPFKRRRDAPVVFWSGVVDVKGSREFVYQVPGTFNGALRVMAVAVNDTSLGVASVQSLVRGDFVLSPNAPVAVAPGDEFDVSVGVANNVRASGPDAAVTVALSTTPHLEVAGPAQHSLRVGALREGVATFRVRARMGADTRLGSATLSFTAGSGPYGAALDTDVSVRPATPHYTIVTAGGFTGSIDVPVQRDLHREHRQLEAAISPLPLVLAHGLSTYLVAFGHMCTEQLVSKAMPQVVLARRPELLAPPRPGLTPGRNFADAVRVLRTRQNAEGGFGLWTASVQASEFASVYAVHLLLEAAERDEYVPADMIQKGNAYLQQLGTIPAQDLAQARTRAYAAYLLTRQGIVTTPMLTGLRERLDDRYPKDWPADLAAAYLAASYQLLKQERLAESLIDKPLERIGQSAAPYRYESYYDPLVHDAQVLYLVARHFPQRARALSAATLADMIKPIQQGRFHTLSAAYTILALDAYATLVSPVVLGKLAITEVPRDGAARSLALPGTLVPRVPFASDTATLRFANSEPLTTFYSVTESGFDRTPPAGELRSGLEVFREYLDAAGTPITSVRLGEEITVRLRFRVVDRPALRDVALVDLLPGGFEPVLIPTPIGGTSGGPGWANPLGGGGTWSAEFADIREERVVLYGTVGPDMAEFTYRIKATNVGRFVVPPAYGESLYDRTVRARSPAGQITVERPSR